MRRESYFICFALFTLFPLLINGLLSAKTVPSRAPLFMVPSYCETECGGISFQYPFGIGPKECYLNKWYEVVCNKSSGKLVPFLPKINSEMVNFSLPMDYGPSHGLVHVKTPVVSSGCSSVQGPTSPLNVTGSPFFISDTNHLVAVGCNTKALITGIKSQVAGCESSCDEKETQGGRNNDICSGYRCCQARLPVDLPQVIGIGMENVDGNTSRGGGGCKVAFLTNETYSTSNITNPEMIHANGYSVVELGWYFDTSDPRSADLMGCVNITQTGMYSTSDGCVCQYGYYFELSYKSCYCVSGFRGNPYTSDGCKDIDECKEDEAICGEDTCKNMPGDYRCVAKNTKPIILGTSLSFGLLILFIGLWGLYKFIKKQRAIMRKKKFFKRNGGLLLQQQLTTTEANVEKTRLFSSNELEKATDHFSKDRVLGHGGQGTVYKGMLADGRIVAVKKSIVVDEDKVEEFINEVVVLSQINHRNIVKLLGCCLETDVPILVYEFIPNGDLSKHLHDQSDEYILTWETRLRIALEIAGALSYLHSAASFPIYHRDIKSNNILLDEKYRAKVSDFGTSRSVTIDHTHLTTIVSGTIGYMDPEYFRTSQFTDKSDVYSFGVVLTELITGERPVSLMRSEECKALATYFIDAMKENKLFDIVDARTKEECSVEQVMAVAELTKRCLSLKGKKRPTMREVSLELERIRSAPLDISEVHIEEREEEDEEEDEDEDQIIETNVDDSWRVNITAPASALDNVSSRLDVEPLILHQTW